ncbi:MAG: nucleotidyltransferase family protein [Clostridia bacterium]|nr:nucleotidyltransferase family protein [Clostridia bacterium]
MNASDILFSLLRYEINGESIGEDIKSIDNETLLKLFELSKAHDLSHLVSDALMKIGVEISKELRQQKVLSIFRSESISLHLKSIKETLSKGEIPFIPLKGAVIRDLYPENWMRTSADIDILVKEEDLDKAIALFEKEKWQADKKNFHDISLYKKGSAPLELHFSIKENMENLDRVLDKVWENATLKEDFEYELSNEFLLFYLLSHIAYHFKKGGCGIRTILDVWLIQEKLKIDEKGLKNLCQEAQIEVFAGKVMELSKTWFEGKTHTDITKKMEEFILFGGLYGNYENRASVEQTVAGGRKKNLLSRIIMPYDKMVIRYPVLKKHKLLTPLFHIARWGSTLKKGTLRRVTAEYNAGNKNSEAKIAKTQELLNEIGLI